MISFIIAGAFFALSACRKEWPEETFYELTEDDIQWVPYYDEGFQNKFFRDQSGQVHELNLYWDANAIDRFGNSTYSEREVDLFNPGRLGDECRTSMTRTAQGLKLEFAMNNYNVRFNESDFVHAAPSMIVRGNIFTNVLVGRLDTMQYQSAPYSKVYISRGVGLVAVELRNGRYYVMQ